MRGSRQPWAVPGEKGKFRQSRVGHRGPEKSSSHRVGKRKQGKAGGDERHEEDQGKAGSHKLI